MSVCNQEATVLARTPVVLRRPALEDEVLHLLDSASSPVLVLAPSGSGKSTFLAQLVARLREPASSKVVTVFIGATEGSSSISRVLHEAYTIEIRLGCH